MYLEDWEDYHKLPVPFVIERIVVADREAAEASVKPGQPVFSPAFDLMGSRHWFEPVRRTLSTYFGEEANRKAKKTVTYIHRQSEHTGLKVREDDHQSLVRALNKMGRDYGYEVHVVSSQFDETGWTERMSAIVKSTVVLGPYSSDLLDSVFMKPSPQATLMEFFPTDTYARDEELVAHSRGLQYIAWWHNRKFTSENLPAVVQPPETQEVRVDVVAVTKAVRDVLASR